MMATAELERLPDYLEPAPIQPAIDVLNYIKDLKPPQLETPSQADGVFLDLQLGRVFGAIVDVHGEVTPNSAGCKQLRGTDGRERFLATLYPPQERGGRSTPGSVHIVIFPHKPYNEQLYTIPINIPLDTGRPLVQHNVKPTRMHAAEIGPQLAPDEAFDEVRHLAAVMINSFQEFSV